MLCFIVFLLMTKAWCFHYMSTTYLFFFTNLFYTEYVFGCIISGVKRKKNTLFCFWIFCCISFDMISLLIKWK